MTNYSTLNCMFNDENIAIHYLINNEILKKTRNCLCGYICNLNIEKRKFYCFRQGCKKKYSSFDNTFFFKKRIKINEILHLAFLWTCEATPLMAENYLGISNKTILKYFKCFRHLIAETIENQENKIGGKSVIVEIDESKFGKRKYNRGHPVEGVWVFGGVERTPERKLFLVDVPNRKEETLLNLIQKYVLPGSIIVSDMWRGYYNLEHKLNMLHFTVNHSKEFVNSETGAHTNTIEGSWSGIKRKIAVRSRTKSLINAHLLEFVWRRQNTKNKWKSFLLAVKFGYN